MTTDLTLLRGGKGSGEILCLCFVLAEMSQPCVEKHINGRPTWRFVCSRLLRRHSASKLVSECVSGGHLGCDNNSLSLTQLIMEPTVLPVSLISTSLSDFIILIVDRDGFMAEVSWEASLKVISQVSPVLCGAIS